MDGGSLTVMILVGGGRNLCRLQGGRSSSTETGRGYYIRFGGGPDH